MCLGVIGVLWSETALAFYFWSDLTFFPLLPVTVFVLFAGFSLPVFIWAYLKPLWQENIRVRDIEYRYLRLKRTPEVIYALLAREQDRNMEFSSDEINLGNDNAQLHITMVMGLHCRPCADEWRIANRWLSLYKDSFRLTVRFFGYNLTGQADQELIDTFTCIYMQSGKEAVRSAITDWYAKMDREKWKEKYLAHISVQPQSSSSKNAAWERTQLINATPTIFIGNRSFHYHLNDLEYLLKEM